MNALLRFPLSVALALLFAASAGAADYPSRIGFSLQHTVPKLNSLASQLTAKQGEVPLDLHFTYDPAAGFSCTGASTVDQLPASCRARQDKNGYNLTITSPQPKTKVTLKGNTGSATAQATYRGAKGRLLRRKPAVTLDFDAAPLTSQVILSPRVGSGGALSGTGSILSAYGGSGNEIALSGKVKGKAVRWTLNYGADRLKFSGREKTGKWIGRLTGRIGLAQVSKSVTIPLTEQPLPTPTATPTPIPDVARFYGTVLKSDGSTPASAADGVLVTLQTDLNGDGTIGAGESATATTNGAGAYDFSYPVAEGKSVTLDFALDGYSKTPKMFPSVALGAVVPVNTTLRQLDDLTLSGQSAQTENGALKFDNLPENINSMKGRVFNPVTETAQFPGEFADESGKMLISSVFAGIEARDAGGAPVTTLASDTKVRMRVPTDTWSTLKDLQSGNDKIDVPLYYYDEKSGQWKRSTSDGWLEDEAGTPLAEAALPSIRDGSYSGNLYAGGNVSHLSYWNIDWPVDTHGCVHGKLVDGNNVIAVGAVVTARGITYTGASAPRTIGADGAFCIDVMRSEAAGEDIDGDGVTGEQNQVGLTAYYGGKYYDLGIVTIPELPATCSTSGCKELGTLTLDPAKEVTASTCTITGTLVYSGTADGGDPGLAAGAPIANGMVFAYDSNAQEAMLSCGDCDYLANTDALGQFSIKTVILLSAEVFGYKANFDNPLSEPIFFGSLTAEGCPTAPVTIKADAWIP